MSWRPGARGGSRRRRTPAGAGPTCTPSMCFRPTPALTWTSSLAPAVTRCRRTHTRPGGSAHWFSPGSVHPCPIPPPTFRQEYVESVVLLDEAGYASGTADKMAVHHDRPPLHLAVSCY